MRLQSNIQYARPCLAGEMKSTIVNRLVGAWMPPHPHYLSKAVNK